MKTIVAALIAASALAAVGSASAQPMYHRHHHMMYHRHHMMRHHRYMMHHHRM